MKKLKVTVTLKEWISVTTILIIWASSCFMVLFISNNYYNTILWILLTLPGLGCWVSLGISLQKYEGRRKIIDDKKL